jgi:hypothetical protein
MPTSQPDIGPLYIKQSEPRTDSSGSSVLLPGVIDLLNPLSVTSQFKVSLHLTNQSGTDKLISHLNNTGVLDNPQDVVSYDFFCSQAEIPGSALASAPEIGSRQGITESFPTRRSYQPFDVTFYVDSEFKIIRLFEEWMNFINPIYSYDGTSTPSPTGLGKFKNRPDFFRFKYPDDYKRIISITKFERNFRKNGTGKLGDVPRITYRMIEAYPDNLSAIPVTYEGSTITRARVRFMYTRYVMDIHKGKDNDK